MVLMSQKSSHQTLSSSSQLSPSVTKKKKANSPRKLQLGYFGVVSSAAMMKPRQPPKHHPVKHMHVSSDASPRDCEDQTKLVIVYEDNFQNNVPRRSTVLPPLIEASSAKGSQVFKMVSVGKNLVMIIQLGGSVQERGSTTCSGTAADDAERFAGGRATDKHYLVLWQRTRRNEGHNHGKRPLSYPTAPGALLQR
jgi:hypothetical protein